MINLCTALRDPRVWGEDANAFRLRSHDQYRKLSTAWGDHMVDKKDAANNHFCPGKDLSYQMITNFLKAFLKRQSKFFLNEEIKDKIVTLPKIAGGTSAWNFQTSNQVNLKQNAI